MPQAVSQISRRAAPQCPSPKLKSTASFRAQVTDTAAVPGLFLSSEQTQQQQEVLPCQEIARPVDGPNHTLGVTCSFWQRPAMSTALVHLLSIYPVEPAPASLRTAAPLTEAQLFWLLECQVGVHMYLDAGLERSFISWIPRYGNSPGAAGHS